MWVCQPALLWTVNACITTLHARIGDARPPAIETQHFTLSYAYKRMQEEFELSNGEETKQESQSREAMDDENGEKATFKESDADCL